MKKPFALKPVESARFRAVSFSLDATRPEEYYAKLEANLAKLHVEGDVLLDLLACNGGSTRRFFAVCFDGHRLLLNTMRSEKAEALGSDVRSICKTFYEKNADKLDRSVLSAVARRALAHQ